MNIDIHAHIIVPEIIRSSAPNEEWRPALSWENGKQFVEFGGRRLGSALREFVDMQTILAEQDKADIDRLVLTPWSSLFRYDADIEASIQANQIQNNALAAIAQAHPDRIVSLGTVPLQDSDVAVAELKRCMHELGLAGVEVGTNVNGKYLGDEQFRPFWAAAEELGAVIQIHPIPGLGGPTNREYYLWNAFANPAETAMTASHMILSGLLEEHPNLKIFLFHGGGHLPYQIGRLDRAYEMRPEASAKISAPPSTYLKKFYFDTVTHSAQALSYLIDLVGVEQVMVGSDYPFDMGYDRPAELVESLNELSRTDKDAILSGNALKMFEWGN